MEQGKLFVLTYQPSKLEDGEILDFKKYKLVNIKAKNHSRCNGTGKAGKNLSTNNFLICSCAKLSYLIGEEQLAEIKIHHQNIFDISTVSDAQIE